MNFQPYTKANKPACLALFDANCPEFFAPNERDDYVEFLGAEPSGYEVCELDGEIVGGFGVIPGRDNKVDLRWILLNPNSQGRGLGSAIMSRVIAVASGQGAVAVDIGASHKSAPFFARFGAQATGEIENGWGPGMHRIDMVLTL